MLVMHLMLQALTSSKARQVFQLLRNTMQYRRITGLLTYLV